MPSGNFIKVFDVMDSGFKDWSFPAFGLIFVAIGIFLFVSPQLIKSFGIPNLNFQSVGQKAFRYFFLCFSILWTSTSFYSTYTRYQRHQKLIRDGSCPVVEGQIENFIPMPYTGHADESFSVNGVRFSYSDYLVSDGFNNTASHGGPINKDSYVRICYDPSGNQILRLEIRDYKGPLKDSSKSEPLFPNNENIKKIGDPNPLSKLPWYSNLFMVFYFLDFFALLMLFTPYLNTFFRLKSAQVVAFKIPSFVDRGKKLKLRNSILILEEGTRSIWLRPRGFNLFQVQLTAGRLIVDDLNESVIGQEVRFSSGFPFITILFLWTAYQFFSVTMPPNPNGIGPGQFVTIAAITFTIFGFISLKILTSRMEKLIEDAISELKQNNIS